MSPEIAYTQKLVTTSCWCGINLAIPADLYSYAKRHGESVCCPLGHKFVFGDTIDEQLAATKRELAEERRRATANRDLLAAEERSHRATRGHLTRQRRRAQAGLCPCCNRSFGDLAHHMTTEHPDFKPEGTPE